MIVVEVMWEEWVDSVVLTWVWLEDLYNKIAIQGHREKGGMVCKGHSCQLPRVDRETPCFLSLPPVYSIAIEFPPVFSWNCYISPHNM